MCSYTKEIRGTNLNTVIHFLRWLMIEFLNITPGYWDTKERLVISFLLQYFFKHKDLELEVNVEPCEFEYENI